MSKTHARFAIPVALIGLLPAAPAVADVGSPFFFSTGDPDRKIATAARPDTAPFEIELADDFVLTTSTAITSATFTGLIPAGATASQVIVEIYRVFPKDSDVGRTSFPVPPFSTTQVPARQNSPSDVALDSRDSATAGDLSFTTSDKGVFDVLNSVQPGGIHPIPDFNTGGDGAVTGEHEVEFNVTLTKPFTLPADHYFFVPQVLLDSGDFLWLSAPRPIVSPGTPFPPGATDLQSWTRDAMLDPDWLRVGTDIVGPPVPGGMAPTFNETFSLTGSVIPEPSTWAMMLLGFTGLVYAAYRKGRQAITIA